MAGEDLRTLPRFRAPNNGRTVVRGPCNPTAVGGELPGPQSPLRAVLGHGRVTYY